MDKLIIVDMQNDFLTGALAVPDAENVIKNVVNKAKHYMRDNCEIYITMDTHRMPAYTSTLEGQKFPVHCVIGTNGYNLCPELGEALAGYRPLKIFNKVSFGDRIMVDHLVRNCGPDDRIEICGVATNICVVTTALMVRSALYNHNIIVDSSACGGTTSEGHVAALDVMRSCNIDVI